MPKHKRNYLQEIKSSYESHEFEKTIEIFRQLVTEKSRATKERTLLLNRIISVADKWIDQTKTPQALFIKGYCLGLLRKREQAISILKEVVELDPTNRFAFYSLGSIYLEQNKFTEAIENFTKAIDLDDHYINAYLNRGNALIELKEYREALENFNKVLQSEKNKHAYNGKANALLGLDDYHSAISNFDEALKLDSKYEKAYFGKGVAFLKDEKYEKAIDCFDEVIKLNSKIAGAYSGRGIAKDYLELYEEAEADYSKALELNSNDKSALFNRGNIYFFSNRNKEAISDFERYLNNKKDSDSYFSKVAQSRIDELLNKIEDPDLNFITELTNKIKSILFFKEQFVTHYTSLSTSQILILKQSLFRLSEGAFLNDTSEGRELFQFLNINLLDNQNESVLEEIFVEKPFIGSFVSDKKHDDLTLWRMYGKEKDTEAKGCAFTINREEFIKNILQRINNTNNLDSSIVINDKQFVFYKVAYWSSKSNSFFIPDSSEEEEKELNSCMSNLKHKIASLKNINTKNYKGKRIVGVLNEVAYLFKTTEYQYEHEIRLVIDGLGFEKFITEFGTPPRVYIELTSLVPVIKRITLGPKVERADEWASCFHYSIKNAGHEAKIVISHLPYK